MENKAPSKGAQATPKPDAGLAPSQRWKSLYLLGGLAPWVTLFFYLCQLIFISWEAYPETIHDWFALFEQNKLKGLFYLNSLDIISMTVLGLMFLALHVALKPEHELAVTTATPFAFVGIAVFVVPRSALLSLVFLSDQYGAAATEVERTQLLAAGRALSALGLPTIQTTGFFIMAVAAFILSIAMLRSRTFGKPVAYVGILAFLCTAADDVSLVLAPSLDTPLLVVAGWLWVVWWLMISWKLLRLARTKN